MKKQLFVIAFLLINFSAQMTPAKPEAINLLTNKNTGIKILSWNIYMLPYISLFNQNAKRAKIIAEQLNNSDYQIIVFQEAFSSKCRNILAKKLIANYPFQYGPANQNFLPFRTNSGLWIVSKLPLTYLGEIQFSSSKGFDAVARKGAVMFEGNLNGSKFQLLATHLQSDFSHTVRNKQCSEIKEHLLNNYYQKDIPQFICGDFNIEMEDSHNYNQMLKTLDAQNGELSGNVKVTYDEVNNNLAKIPHGKPKIIDYVLVRNAKLIYNVERKVQTFLSKIDGRITHLSDHYAMEFSLDFYSKTENLDQQLLTVR